jgi:hypothetical protein
MPALAPTILDDAADFTVVATNPAAMQTAQHSLILWAARKIHAIKGDLITAQEQLDLAKKNKWNTSAWSREVGKHERRAEFYRKIKMALEAGYYIVPPFPIDIFAIRTAKATPKAMHSRLRDNHDQSAQILPAGEGRYVDSKPHCDSYTDQIRQKDGSVNQVTTYYADRFSDVDFPFKLARSEIREATDKALSLKVFDQVGVLPRVRAPDPVVCGQILIPDQRYGEKAVTFFVAWWLDTKTL